MDISDKKFIHIREKAEREYKNVSSVYCPYLRKDVAFNAGGLEHLKFKRRNHARSRKDQYVRFRCLPLASKILSLSHTLQGHQERNEMVRIKEGKKKWNHIMKLVEYFEFIAVINEFRVRVIVKKVDGGALHFWSIIPFWKMDPISEKRIMHNGNPSED